jgi:hypothetical protein
MRNRVCNSGTSLFSKQNGRAVVFKLKSAYADIEGEKYFAGRSYGQHWITGCEVACRQRGKLIPGRKK